MSNTEKPDAAEAETKKPDAEHTGAQRPALIASIEVYRAQDGTFHTNLTHDGHTLPQHTCKVEDEVLEAVEGFLRNIFDAA